MEDGEAVQQFEIMRDRLSEAYARIDQHIGARDPRRLGRRDSLLQPGIDFDQYVAVAWRILHRSRITLMVHQDHRNARRRDDPGRAIVMGQSGNVIDHPRSRHQRGLDHRGFARVDGHRRAARGELLDDRQDALDLVAFPHIVSAGPGRFAADVDQRRPCRRHHGAGLGGGAGVGELAAIGETVGRGVDNAHNLRLVEPDCATAQLKRWTRGNDPGPCAGHGLVEAGLDALDGDKLARTVAVDQFDRGEPAKPASQPRDLAIVTKWGIDEAGRAEDGFRHRL